MPRWELAAEGQAVDDVRDVCEGPIDVVVLALRLHVEVACVSDMS